MNRSHIDVATALSVAMSAAIAVVAGRLAGQWTWSLFTALVGVVILVAGLEIVRGRAARAGARSQDGIDSPGPTSATDSVAARGTQSQAAGRDIRNVKIGTGGAAGLVGVFLVASVLSGGTVLFGRYEFGPAAPPVPTSDVAASAVGASPASDTGRSPVGVDQTYQSDFILTVLIGGQDLDPPDDTLGLADVSYSPSSGALAFLNRAAAAPAPSESGLTPDLCRSANGWSSRIDADAALGSTSCLRTSDDRYGTISITEINHDLGHAYVTWTVWY